MTRLTFEEKRKIAHEKLDQWINHEMPKTFHFHKGRYNSGDVLDLGLLHPAMIDAYNSFPGVINKPETVIVKGKKYLLSDIKQLQEVIE